MNAKILLAAAATAVLAVPAVAQQPAPYDHGPAVAPPIDSSANRPARDYEAPPMAETGRAADTAAQASDLRAGASVKDGAGAEIGRVVKVDGGMVTLSSQGKTTQVPLSSLSTSGSDIVSSSSRADVWAPR
ncbi:hypothetical protein [Phenylobacterium sp.]|uniref:hypothetical protein n=1 Tax=Phenylobacterium sp. TaxID=1871053 RepID=UPI0028983D9A|nr:hypothetical protein [Phenylobacterium sp.]